jgi:hypothetical protein
VAALESFGLLEENIDFGLTGAPQIEKLIISVQDNAHFY